MCLLKIFAFSKPVRPSFRMKSYKSKKQKSKDVPVATFAVKLAKELLQETSESPFVLAATPSSIRRSFHNLNTEEVVPHSCDQTSPHSNKYEPSYPYQPLIESG